MEDSMEDGIKKDKIIEELKPIEIEGELDEFIDKTTKIFGCGNLLLVYQKEINESYKDNIARQLRKSGFIVTVKKFELKNNRNFIENDIVKLVLGIGDEFLSNIVANYATEKNIKSAFVSFYEHKKRKGDILVFQDNIFLKKKIKEHVITFYDKKMLVDKKDKYIAGAVGFMLADLVNAFDKMITTLVNSGKLEVDKYLIKINDYNLYFKENKQIEFGDYSSVFPSSFLYSLTNSEITIGEALFIFSYLQIILYKKFLKFDGFDLSPPKDYSLFFQRLENLFSCDLSKLKKSFDFYNPERYMKASFIIKEYRDELLELFQKVEELAPYFFKKFKRRYEDLGYSLKKNIKGNDIREYLTFGASFFPYFSVLKHIDQSGEIKWLV